MGDVTKMSRVSLLIVLILLLSRSGYPTSTVTPSLNRTLSSLITATSQVTTTATTQRPFTCPVDCVCRGPETVDCRGSGVRNVTNFLANQPVVKLDLSHTDIRRLGPFAFRHLPLLEDLNLAGNMLIDIDIDAFHHTQLKFLSLQSAHLSHIPFSLFSRLPNLQTMRLDGNEISQLDPLLLAGLNSLRHLRLDVNQLSSVPQETLSRVTALEVLNLSYNKIKAIPEGAFQNLTSLVVLMMDHNDIEFIDDAAFMGLSSLKILELRHNQIKHLPAHFQHTPMLTELYLNNNNITNIKSGVFQQVQRLTILELRGNPLSNVEWEAFAFMPRLQKLILSEVKELRQFPSLNGSSAIEMIRIDRAKIRVLPKDLCLFVPHLRSLDVKSNWIEALPDFSRCKSLRLLDLSHNKIGSLPDYTFQHQAHLHDLLLAHNKITLVPEHAFTGLRKLKILDLSENEIESVHPDTFLPLTEVQDVNLGHNRFPVFPSVGLENALHIKVHNNPYLREFPMPAAFPRVKTLALSYAYHCCPFQAPATLAGIYNGAGGIVDDTSLRDSIIFPSNEHDIDLTAWAKGETMWVDSNPVWTNISQQWANMASAANNLNLSEAEIEKLLSSSPGGGKSGVLLTATRVAQDKRNLITCIPEPSPFMPCQDLFDWWSLRCGVWIVFLMALLGNGAVVFVLIFARSKIDVPRFLVCNLGMADFFMGIYLGFLAVVDASTLGEFRMYAIPWQLSAGCQVAGFFGVLSSELSVFTLAVITMERNYAITHAMHLNKRLSLRHASYIMAAGWVFALIMAFLPLVGVSDYRKFAVCLPFEVGNAVSKGYVVFLMFINGVAFLILMGCYLKMYCAIRGSQAWNSNDSRIAKRMALLVFTDFLCWAPIAFFSLTAASGLQFVSLEEAKIFTVFILPLNSCCNPFLYAILTKQFKKDCVMICKAIEESRVTRGIGRCRHSSNFSNRQTPGNTNSLGDRNSSKDGSSCNCNQGKLLKDGKTDSSNSNSSSHHHHHHHHHRRRLEWLRSPIRTFLRRIRAVERDMGESSSSANEYAYQIAEIQQKQQHRNKHRRAESVSSDNYSSSRSDSVKAIGCGLPLRMAGRRRNSWTVTRKPSSDSNLSSSRNDSSTSAMTASTSAGTTTWRHSRSSVSSEGGSSVKGSSVREKQPVPKGTAVPMTHLPSVDAPRRTSSIRDKNSRALPTSPLAAGILRQQSVTTPTGSLVQRTIIGQTLSTGSNDGTSPQIHLPSANLPLVVVAAAGPSGVKAKPRLMRQVAIQQEEAAAAAAAAGHASERGKSVKFDTSSLLAEERPPSTHFCPLHAPRLEGVWESSIEEDDQEDEEEDEEEGGSRARSLFQAVAAIYTNRDKNRLGLSGFIPRKLSTISSRSCSINPEAEEAVSASVVAVIEELRPSHSSELLNVTDAPVYRGIDERVLSKSDNDLYCPQRPAEEDRPVGSMIRLPVIKKPTAASVTKQAISGITSSSIEMIDDDLDDDVFQQQPLQQQQPQLRSGNNNPSSSERDPLLE